MSRGRKAGRGILSTERKTREGVAGRRTRRDVNGKREALSSAAFVHSCPPHLFCVMFVRMIFLHVFIGLGFLSFSALFFLAHTVISIAFT